MGLVPHGRARTEKFKHVKYLNVPWIGGSDFYRRLLSCTAPHLEELLSAIADVETTGPSIWSALQGLSRLKRLQIFCDRVGPDREKFPYAPILEIANRLETLEELEIDDSRCQFLAKRSVYITGGSLCLPWPGSEAR